MLTAQQLGSFTQLSFNSGMANASLCPQTCTVTSISRKK